MPLEHRDHENASAAVHEALIAPSRDESSIGTQKHEAHKPSYQTDEKVMWNSPTRRWDSLRNWWLEILCLVVVTAALIAITFTLFSHQNRPLPEWPYSVSVNTLVAVYVVVLKGAMLLIITEGIEALSLTRIVANTLRSQSNEVDVVQEDSTPRRSLHVRFGESRTMGGTSVTLDTSCTVAWIFIASL